jgi:hypothetical protein
MSLRRIATSVAGSLIAGLLIMVPVSATSAGLAAPVFHRPIIAVNASQSNNWSGYGQGTLEQGNNTMFTEIEGTWKVPHVSQHKPGEAEYSSTWVGIGGGCVDANCQVTDNTLIQAGTEQDVDTSGTPSYSAWYELIPQPSTPITTMTIHAGDKMHVSITLLSPFMWEFNVQDLSTHQKFTLDTAYSSSEDTAEWITETPVVIDSSGGVTIGPLPDLSKVHIDKAITNTANAHLQNSEQIQLVDTNSQPLATPGNVDPDTDGFFDCTYAATCKTPKKS